MTPTLRAVGLLAVAALSALVVPAVVAVLLMAAVVAVTVADALVVRRPPTVHRHIPTHLSRGVVVPAVVDVDTGLPVVVHQPGTAGVRLEPSTAPGHLDASVIPSLRGRHLLGPVAVRVTGPFRMGAWFHRVGEPLTVDVYPDLPAAARIATDVRRGRFAVDGRHRRGPLGLGTELESVREYQPDDDIRHVNWAATLRVGRPMSNQYRTEQDRSVVCLVDLGRLMATPVGDRTRLDVALDAAVALAAVADAVGDRIGVIAFDDRIRRRLTPRRDGGRALIESTWDLQPVPTDADYDLAFHLAADMKRSLVVIFTDLLDQVAARPLVAAVPVLTRHHAVTVASVSDPTIGEILRRPPTDLQDATEAGVAAELEAAGRLATRRLVAVGASVVYAEPDVFASRVVASYLRAKRRALL